MGIFSPRRWMGLTPAICTVLCFMLSACNSTDEPIEEALSNAKPEMIHLSNGDVVVLSDTTTYTVDAAEVDDVVMMSEKHQKICSVRLAERQQLAYGLMGLTARSLKLIGKSIC